MRKRAMISSACAALAVLSLSACSLWSKADPSPSDEPSVPVPSASASPSPSPSPSVEELPAGIPTDHAEPAQTAGPLSAHITLASFDLDSGGMLVGGFVNGASQDGGLCEFVITPTGGSSMRVQSTGVENGATTSCGSQIVPSTSVPSGTYSVILTYSNGGMTATSESVQVTIP